jgi:DICT domain-containing protein/signal transduction histidine kinase
MTMSNPTSVLGELLAQMPRLRAHLYFKTSLTALSHAMEDRVLAGGDRDRPLSIASFQQEKFYRQEAHRYRRLGEIGEVYVLCAPEAGFSSDGVDGYEKIAFPPTDALGQEWHLVVIGAQSAACLICREKILPTSELSVLPEIDPSRRFEGIWTFDRQVAIAAANILLDRIVGYRPELAKKIAATKKKIAATTKASISDRDDAASADAFVQRLVTYIQARQYKLLKAYKSIEEKESRERSINSIAEAMRRSIDASEIVQIAANELGIATRVSRCIIYQCQATTKSVKIDREYLAHPLVPSLLGSDWQLDNNPLVRAAIDGQEAVFLADIDPQILPTNFANNWGIKDYLIVPIVYQEKILGAIELHQLQSDSLPWSHDMVNIVEAIATQIGSTLMQSAAYANLEYLNHQLAALDRTRANLVAITGHELRTPLSTIQVCLESLASEPDMSPELRKVMLNTALADAERMRKLVQDFLTLSQLESGQFQWHPEPVSLSECISLAISGLNAYSYEFSLPEIAIDISPKLPLVSADGEWLVEVLTKLLDNACKFNSSDRGRVTIYARHRPKQPTIEVIVADTGRGIAPELLQTVFERFYQAEGALRRTTGGTGLGLAICRQIVINWGGEIWAESDGKNNGSRFHFTIPTV